MKHVKYPRINGCWQLKEVAYLRLQGFDHPSYKYCITEKVHGTNLSFNMNQDELKVAKRNSFIKDGENFFQYLRMKESNGYKVRDLWNQLAKEGYEIDELRVYGELFGGHYPYPDIKKLPRIQNVQKIQKGVHYHPDINFYVFDIMVNDRFLPMDEVCRLCEEVNIFYARILFIGTFDECFVHSNQFQTKIPEWLGLPLFDPNEKHEVTRMVIDRMSLESGLQMIEKKITYYGNICEGTVIKPVIPLFYDDGSRVILKSKNDVFKVVSREGKEKRETKELSDFAMDTLELISVYINENRLRSVLSKEGTFTKKDFKKIFDLFKRDIYEDFNMNHNNLRDMLKIDKREIDKVVGKLCTEIWRPIFLSEAER